MEIEKLKVSCFKPSLLYAIIRPPWDNLMSDVRQGGRTEGIVSGTLRGV